MTAHFKLNQSGRLGRCSHADKVSYESRKWAKKGLKRTALLKAEAVSAWNTYRCEHCSLYHIGHARGRWSK